MSFGEWLDYRYTTYKKNSLKPKTQLDYENRIYSHIIPSVGNIELKSLSQNDLQQFYTKVNGKRKARNIYAPTREECEQKLAILITEMKAEIALIKQSKSASQ